MRWVWLIALVLAAGVTGPRAQGQTGPTLAPQASTGTVVSPVVTIDSERLFNQSLFGQRVLADVQAQTEALAAENRKIEADLTAEEQGLTARRPGMAADAFRAEANDFDSRVQAIRQAQDAKERALQQAVSDGRDAFAAAARPVLGQLMLDRGAVVILERRAILLGIGSVDITDAAIAAIDASVGDGNPSALSVPDIAPDTTPDTAPPDVPLDPLGLPASDGNN